MASFSNKNPAELTATEFWNTTGDEVSARTLWRFLHVKKSLHEWLSPILAELDAKAGIDYKIGSCRDAIVGAAGQVMLSADLALEIAILETTSRGRETRQYLIDSEKEFSKRKMDNKSQTN